MFNRPVTLKAFTPLMELERNKCLSIGHSIGRSELPHDKKKETSLCFGYVRSLKNSITFYSPCDFRVKNCDGNLTYDFPQGIGNFIQTSMHDGLNRFGSAKVAVTKINFPISLLCEGGHEWVVCSHLLNFSGMIIPSGIDDYSIAHGMDLFNVVPEGSEYTVTAGTPIASLYLRSGKKIAIDLQYDPVMWDRLEAQRVHFHFKADALKRHSLRCRKSF